MPTITTTPTITTMPTTTPTMLITTPPTTTPTTTTTKPPTTKPPTATMKNTTATSTNAIDYSEFYFTGLKKWNSKSQILCGKPNETPFLIAIT